MRSEASITDHIHALRDGDREAAWPLWEHCYPRAVAMARGVIGQIARSLDDEEDMALSALHALFDRIQDQAQPTREPWNRQELWRVLAGIIRNKAKQRYRWATQTKRDARKTEQQAPAALDEFARPDPPPDQEMLVREELDRLLDRLGSNSGDLRQVALLKLDGYSNREIATRMGIAVKSVERKLSRIRRHWQDEVS
jgi:RNA polymerase sigma factor (sigma-70 family)